MIRLVFRDTVDQRENGVIAAEADVASRMNARAALAYEDVASAHGLASVDLDTAALSRAVPPIARRSLSFFMRHGSDLHQPTSEAAGVVSLSGATGDEPPSVTTDSAPRLISWMRRTVSSCRCPRLRR